MKSIKNVLKTHKLTDKGGYITKEFQDYGYRLAMDMNEKSRVSLYIKLAKSTPREHLERARTFVLDAPNVKNRGRLFLWAVGRINKGQPLTKD